LSGEEEEEGEKRRIRIRRKDGGERGGVGRTSSRL